MTPTSILTAVYVPRNEQLVLDESYPIHELEDNEIVLEVAPGQIAASMESTAVASFIDDGSLNEPEDQPNPTSIELFGIWERSGIEEIP
ncbi:hypothetical protein DFH09DRAFT_1322657 [Mycena vulgaris]|nr:hypothetical protein DFH09DRAFT_1322657 [Mycena vulgaris]